MMTHAEMTIKKIAGTALAIFFYTLTSFCCPMIAVRLEKIIIFAYEFANEHVIDKNVK